MDEQAKRKNVAKKSAENPSKEFLKVKIKQQEFAVGEAVEFSITKNESAYGTIEKIF